MKLPLRILLLMALLAGLAAPSANASHVLGADMTWTCDPNDPCIYTFTFTYYQDCPDEDLLEAPGFHFSCPGSTLTIPGNQGQWTTEETVEITQVCSPDSSDCNGGYIPGVQKYVRSTDYNLCTTPLCASWEVGWEECCRSNQITSIENAFNTRMYAHVTIPMDLNDCNSSPTFISDPIINICSGQNSTYSLAATDPDGDLLQYSLIGCYQNAIDLVDYWPGYSPADPLGPNGDVALDQNTGELSFSNLTGTMVGIMCVRVDEIRNGQVIGSMVRDIQVRIINCSNNLPTLSGFGGSIEYSSKACVGTANCFEIFSDDVDLPDLLSVALLGGPPGMTITTAGSPHPTATICWTPGPEDAGIHTFILEVWDDACPLIGLQQYTYTLEVGSCEHCEEHEANWYAQEEFLNPCNFYFFDTSTPGSSNVTWDFGSGPLVSGSPATHSFPGAGTYSVTMYSEYFPPGFPELSCLDRHTATVVVNCSIKEEKGGSKMAWNEQTSTLEIQLDRTDVREASDVSIYDLSGKLLFEYSGVRESEVRFDLSGVAPGIYLVRTRTGKQLETRKFARP